MLSDMESNEVTDRAAAEAELSSLRADRTALAERVLVPWWYDALLSLLVFGLLSSYSARSNWVTLPAVAVFLLGLSGMKVLYRRLTGVWVNGFRKGAARPTRGHGGGGRGDRRRPVRREPVVDAHLRRRAARGAVTAVAPRFDAVIHPPPRLQVCGLLAAVDTMDFAAVRDTVGVSDSVLSKHVKQLEEAGYVRVRKATRASRLRTSLALTAEGRAAFDAHVAELRRITGG
jgi:DNA-binding transcriptional ArsR family regulator